MIVVGVLGVVLWLVVWASWSRSHRPAYRDEEPVYRKEPVYREEPAVYREEPAVYRADAPADEAPPTGRYPERQYYDDYRR
jgi:hypothetical protein